MVTLSRQLPLRFAVLLLFAAQLCLVAHAAEFGAGPHTHDGIVCDLAVNDDDDIALAATPGVAAAPTLLVLYAAADPHRPLHDSHNWWRPPATGPPASLNL